MTHCHTVDKHHRIHHDKPRRHGTLNGYLLSTSHTIESLTIYIFDSPAIPFGNTAIHSLTLLQSGWQKNTL